MTVLELIHDLEQFDPDRQVRVATAQDADWELASVYLDDPTGVVWIDVEPDIELSHDGCWATTFSGEEYPTVRPGGLMMAARA